MFAFRASRAISMASQRAASVESFKVMDILRRANELQTLGHDVVHCEVGQPETGAPTKVANAAVAALKEPKVMGYTDAFGLPALREKISAHYQEKYGVKAEQIPTSRIVVTTGSSAGFLLAFTGCFDIGDNVAIASCGYPCYRNILSALGCSIATVPINNEFKITATELDKEVYRRKKADEKPLRGLIMSSPGNPTGAMLSSDELEELCDFCETEDIQFLSDEIYHGICYEKEEKTALQFSSKALIINSFSKYYSMSGWRLGWMVIPESLIDPINRLQQNMFINAPTVSQTAALTCWDDDTIEQLETHLDKYRTNRNHILDQLKKFKEIDANNIAPADGGFYIYIDLGEQNTAPGYGSVKMCQTLLEEEFVAFTPGIDFEDPSTTVGDRRFRISYSGGIDCIEEAMKRFYRFWPTWIERVKAAKKKSSDDKSFNAA